MKPRNPYRWLPRKEEKEKEKRDRRSNRDRQTGSPSQEEHIQKVGVTGQSGKKNGDAFMTGTMTMMTLTMMMTTKSDCV
jgi:hypothetical protein